LVNVVDVPAHTVSVPPIAGGAPFTVTILDVVQPALTLYTIVTVPAFTPVTTPPSEIVAIAVLELLHEPVVNSCARVISEPIQTLEGPVMFASIGSTSIERVLKQPALVV
jgi:hypothetical protein